MKKHFLSLAVACLAVATFTNQSYAQSTKPRFGLKAGATLMTLGSATENGVSINYDNRLGFQAGGYADIPLSETVAVLPQLLFSQKGGNVNLSGNGVTLKGTLQLNYLDLPVLFGFNATPALRFFAGPQVALLLSQKTTATVTGPGGSASDSGSSTDGFRKTLLGGNLGAGYKLTDNVGVNLHYMFDFQNTSDGSTSDTGEKNRGFGLSLSYLF